MGKPSEKIFNYMLTIGFVLLLVIFMVSLIGISRFVLADTSNFRQHVIDTSNLLQDIDEVERNTRLLENESQNLIDENLISFKLSQKSYNIVDYSFAELNENKSVLVLHIDSEIFENNNHIGIIPNSLENLSVHDVIMYNGSKVGSIVKINENTFEIFDFDGENIVSIFKEEVEGLILFKDEKNK